MNNKVTCMKDAVDQLLFYILDTLNIKYNSHLQYRFSSQPTGIRVIFDDGNVTTTSFHERPDLSGMVRAFNYIVYGRSYE